MNVKDAVYTAGAFVADLFAEEGIQHIGLEEVAFDDEKKVWNVTMGFFRDLDRHTGLAAAIGSSPEIDAPSWRKRTFKIVSVDDRTGEVLSLRHRSLSADD